MEWFFYFWNMQVLAYTDGSSLGNPGPGGFAAVLLFPEKKLKKEISEGFRRTTNNRMELLGVITALETLKKPNTPITIYTDSKYVCDAINKKWVLGWQKKGFKGKKNPDLWRRFLNVYKAQNVTIEWVKGHAGDVWNERADVLAVAAAKSEKHKKVDAFFENAEKEGNLFG